MRLSQGAKELLEWTTKQGASAGMKLPPHHLQYTWRDWGA